MNSAGKIAMIFIVFSIMMFLFSGAGCAGKKKNPPAPENIAAPIEMGSPGDAASTASPGAASTDYSVESFRFSRSGSETQTGAPGKLSRAAKKKADGYVTEGAVLAGRGKWKEVVAELEKAREINPGDPKIYFAMGLTFNSLALEGKKEYRARAIESFKKTIELEPENEEAYFILARIYGESGNKDDIDMAVQYYRIIISMPDKTRRESEIKKISKIRIEELTGLKNEMEKLDMEIKESPGSSGVLVKRGDFFLEQNRADEAMKNYEEALKTTPESAEAHLGMSRVFLAKFLQERREIAIPTGVPKNTKPDDEAKIRAMNAMKIREKFAQKNPENLKEAEKECKASLETNPDMPQALLVMGRIYDESGRTKEALQYYEKYIRAEKDSKAPGMERIKERIDILKSL